jgi:hypothetical protein
MIAEQIDEGKVKNPLCKGSEISFSWTCISRFAVLYSSHEIYPPAEYMPALEKHSLLRDIEKQW